MAVGPGCLFSRGARGPYSASGERMNRLFNARVNVAQDYVDKDKYRVGH